MKSIISRVVAVQLVFCASISARSSLYDAKRSHKALDLSEHQIKKIALKNATDHFNRVLDEILIPRVVGTEGHKKVANFIVDEMTNLNWAVERNTFRDVAPVFGELEFENIIAKLNPHADRYLILACHYDSKYMREHNFVGATDSAVPCTMMINLAKVMERELSEIKRNNDVSLAFIFFDGEEAFRQWGPKDSIYGARHLADKWHKQEFITKNNDLTNHIDRIDVLVLLDLLGASDPKFYSYFVETERWFVRLVEIEESLGEMGQLKKEYKSGYDSRYFIPRSVGSHIEDDHLPFMKLGVPILHVIPSPFPDVWHKPSDDKSALDMDTIENLNKIFRVFVSEYLNIKI